MKDSYILIKKVLGVVLIIIGIFGLFIPLLQGVFLIMLGLFLFGAKSLLKKFKKFIAWLKNIYF